MNKILLTGSTGFIGSTILKVLSKKYRIYCLNRKNIKNQKNIKNIFFKDYSDLNKKLGKINIDIVIHCATHYVKNHTHKDISKLAESNLVFGNIILENLKNMNVKLFINFTSVWENFNGIRDNFFNLYSVYKKNFSNLIVYYKKIIPYVKFYNLYISDTFGVNDKRLKIINILKQNYKKNKVTKIISTNLYINLLNVNDIADFVSIIITKRIKPGDYNLINSNDYCFFDIIKKFNKDSKKKLKIKWLSKKIVKEKIYNKKKLKKWTPKYSKIGDIINIIKN